MKVEEIKQYCLNKYKAYEECPFGDVPICYKLNNKIFAQLYPYPHDFKITLKCTADAGQFYRMVYPGKVVRGYHCPPVQQPYWNTVYLDDFPDEELLNMIDHAYETVLRSFSKKMQQQILQRSS
ncbi:MAG: MmcQ/YjbR family DNA-binding protein [Lachnospiraceae bacterium]|nr:MmcQ/YjbR family DNA-binding protein [Lachnospiraceae bacterium]